MWRVIYGMPAAIAIFQIVWFLVIFKYEPVAFCIANDRDNEAKAFLKWVYRAERNRNNLDELIENHIEFLK